MVLLLFLSSCSLFCDVQCFVVFSCSCCVLLLCCVYCLLFVLLNVLCPFCVSWYGCGAVLNLLFFVFIVLCLFSVFVSALCFLLFVWLSFCFGFMWCLSMSFRVMH